MKHADIVIGNSSSGIIEAPSLKTPSVNIGDRQRGRIKAKSVIDCKPGKNSIIDAMKKGLSEKLLSDKMIFKNPYDKKNTSINIINTIKNIDLNTILKKKFYSLY
jgi:GDP/UDP-N,N'-diacetylbacillosamine 2-epimerase (hydrolysing)